MAIIRGNEALGGSGNTAIVEFDGGVEPGVVAGDPLGAQKISFTVTSMGASMYSTMSAAHNTHGANATALSNVVGLLLKELIRKKIIKGTYGL